MVLKAQKGQGQPISLVHVIVILQSFHCKPPQSHTGDKLPLIRPVGPTAGPTGGKGCAAAVCGRNVGPPYWHTPVLHIGPILRLLRKVGFG